MMFRSTVCSGALLLTTSLLMIAQAETTLKEAVDFAKTHCVGTSSADGYYRTDGLSVDQQDRLIIDDYMDPKVKTVDPFTRSFIIDISKLEQIIPQQDGVGLRFICKPSSCYQKGTHGPDFYNNNALIYCGDKRDQVETLFRKLSGLIAPKDAE